MPATTFWVRPPSATGSVDPIPFDPAAGKPAMTARVWVDPGYDVGKVMRIHVADTVSKTTRGRLVVRTPSFVSAISPSA